MQLKKRDKAVNKKDFGFVTIGFQETQKIHKWLPDICWLWNENREVAVNINLCHPHRGLGEKSRDRK